MGHLSSANPDDLVRVGEPGVPAAVRAVHASLHRLRLWHVFSRNLEARSCRDAAQKRYRLGHIGIPLSDEMKSFLGMVDDADGKCYVAVHTRGDRQLLLSAVGPAIGRRGMIRRLEPEEIERLGMAYGLVNPFAPFTLDTQLLQLPVVQLFDADLLTRSAPPTTVMTNAGDLTWAVEFDAVDLHRAMMAAGIESRKGDVSESEPEVPPRAGDLAGDRQVNADRGGKIVIITGNAPESGLRLAELIHSKTRVLLGANCHGDVSMPAVDVVSLPGMGLSMELDLREEAVWRVLRSGVQQACDTGATMLALACHTTHYFTPRIRELCSEHPTRFVSMADETGSWLRSRGIRRVGLIGLTFVAHMGPWSAYREALGDIEVESPTVATLEDIAALAYRVKTEGVTASGITRLRDLLRGSVESNDLVLALTELSLLIDHLRHKSRGGRHLIDPLDIYAESLARQFVGSRTPLEEGSPLSLN